MGCPCASKPIQQTSRPLQASNPQPTDCDFTRQIIQAWQTKLACVKLNNKLNLIGLDTSQANVYLGYLQSALNYPDNYCYYLVKLQEFQLNILPRIITNVSECNN